jgi:hypothetical protein
MSKPPRNKKARLKVAKSSSSRHQQKEDEMLKSSMMKFAEEMFEFDKEGNVIKRKMDVKGIEVPKDEDEEIDPNSLLPKPEKKIKVEKQKKKKVNTNTGISFEDLLKKPD